MKNQISKLDKALALSGKNDLHIHVIEKDNDYPIYIPHWSTHFVMKENKILQTSTRDGIINYICNNFS